MADDDLTSLEPAGMTPGPDQPVQPTVQDLTALGKPKPAPEMSVWDQPTEAEEAKGAREAVGSQVEARAARKTPTYQAREPKPASRESAVEENPYERHLSGPQDDGPENLERMRLYAVNMRYRGNAMGAIDLRAMAQIYQEQDPPGIDAVEKKKRQNARAQYEDVVADLIAYDLMPTWSGLPQLAGAVVGTVGGALTSPEAALGWASTGASMVARTAKAGLQQGLISASLDPVVQWLNIDAGVEKDYEWEKTAGAFAFGAGLGAVFHGAGEGIASYLGQRELRKNLIEMSRIDNDLINMEFSLWTQDPRNGIFGIRDTSLDETVRPLSTFDDVMQRQREQMFDENKRWRRSSPTRQEIVTDEARWTAMNNEASETIGRMRDEFEFDDADLASISAFYRRGEGETPRDAFERAFDRYYAAEERAALQYFDLDNDVLRDVEGHYGPTIEHIEEIPYGNEPVRPSERGGETVAAEVRSGPGEGEGSGGRSESIGETGVGSRPVMAEAGVRGESIEGPGDEVMALRTARGTPMADEVRRNASTGVAAAAEFSQQQSAVLKSMHQRAQDLAEAIDFPLRQGRMGNVDAETHGWYNTKSGVVRVRELADFEVVIHEAGHALEKKIGAPLAAEIQKHAAELGPLDYNPTGRQDPREGFAEWMSQRVSNPARAQVLAPNFSIIFDAVLAQKAPHILDLLSEMAKAHQAWNNATSVDIAAAVVRNTIPDSNLTKAADALSKDKIAITAETVVRKAYESIVERGAPLQAAVRELHVLLQKQRGGALVTDMAAYNPYIMWQALQRSSQAAFIDFRFGAVPWHSDGRSVGPGVVDVMNEALGRPGPLGGWGIGGGWGWFKKWDPPKIEWFDRYLATRMTDHLWDRYARGLLDAEPSPLKAGDARQAVLDMDKEFPTFRKAADMLQQYIDNIRQKAFDAGLLTPEQLAWMRDHDFYVPMRRVFDDMPGARYSGPRDASTLASAVKQRRGSERDIDSPIRNVMRQTIALENDIARNEVNRLLLTLAEQVKGEGGKYAERLTGVRALKYVHDFEKAIKDRAATVGIPDADARMMIDALKAGDDELIGEFWKMERAVAGGDPVVFVWEGGKPVPVQVMTKGKDWNSGQHDLYALLTATPAPIMDLWANGLQMGASFFRQTITSMPTFLLSNYLKDQLQVALTRPGYIPFFGGLKGIWQELAESDIARMRAGSGGEMGGSLVGALEKKVKADVRDLQRQGYMAQRVGSLRDALELMQLTEAGTRNSVFEDVFNKSIKRGLSPYEALQEARHQSSDIMPFGRRGSMMEYLRRLVPFLNANIQGQDKYTFRTLIEPWFRDKVTTRDIENRQNSINALLTAGAGGAAFGVGYAALMWENEDYRDTRADIRGTNFVIPIGGGHVLLSPKPYEMGVFFTMGEAFFAQWFAKDPSAASHFAESIKAAYQMPNPLWNTYGIGTTMELEANYSHFRGGPIVPGTVRNAAYPELEYTERTSPMAKWIGDKMGWSPMKVEYAASGYAGGLGQMVMDASRHIDADTPQASLDETMFVKRFIKRNERISQRTKEFWDLMAHENGKYIQGASGYRKVLSEAVIRGAPPERANQFLNQMPVSQRVYTVLSEAGNEQGKAAFTADEKRLHPLVRARDAVQVLNGLARDIQDNKVVPYRAGKERERMMLDPQQRRQLIDTIVTMAGLEMRNAMVVTGERGFANRPIYDSADEMAEISKISPQMADEISTRMASAKVPKFEAVQKAWPGVRDEVVSRGSGAQLLSFSSEVRSQGYQFGGVRVRRPAPVRMPIGPQPVSP